MSRTYRKPSQVVECTEENYIAGERDYYNRRSYRMQRIRLSEDEVAVRLADARRYFEERVRWHSRDEHGTYTLKRVCVGRNPDGTFEYEMAKEYDVFRPYVTKFKYVKVAQTEDDIDDAIEKERQRYRSFFRDGKLNDGSARKNYKTDCKRSLRRRNKALCHDIIRDDDWEDKVYPDRDQDKYKAWVWW